MKNPCGYAHALIDLNQDVVPEVLMYCILVKPGANPFIKEVRYQKRATADITQVEIATIVDSETNQKFLKRIYCAEYNIGRLFPDINFAFRVIEEDCLSLKLKSLSKFEDFYRVKLRK